MNKKQRIEQMKEAVKNARNDDSVTEAGKWAQKLDKMGKVFAIISIVLGVICAIMYAGQTGHYNPGAGVVVFFFVLILFGLASAFTYIMFHLISIALDVLGGVLQYSRQTAELQSILIECAIEKDTDENLGGINKTVSNSSNQNNAANSFKNNQNTADSSSNCKDNSVEEINQAGKDLGFRKCPNCSMKYYNYEEKCAYCGEQLVK